jgi:hypothetical protein
MTKITEEFVYNNANVYSVIKSIITLQGGLVVRNIHGLYWIVILTPCIGQIDNHALKESRNFCKSSLNNFSRPRFSCGNYFVDKGGHLW